MEKDNKQSNNHQCPICSKSVRTNPRYLAEVCAACDGITTDVELIFTMKTLAEDVLLILLTQIRKKSMKAIYVISITLNVSQKKDILVELLFNHIKKISSQFVLYSLDSYFYQDFFIFQTTSSPPH
jgi:hypothetical protein